MKITQLFPNIPPDAAALLQWIKEIHPTMGIAYTVDHSIEPKGKARFVKKVGNTEYYVGSHGTRFRMTKVKKGLSFTFFYKRGVWHGSSN